MDASILVLLGALVGAGAGVAGQLLTVASSGRNERRRLAVESGFREWEALQEIAAKSSRGMEVFPPVLFVHFNHELIQMIDSRGGLTPVKYASLIEKRDGIRDVIRADERRRESQA